MLPKVCSFICYKNYHHGQLYNFASLFLFLGFNSSLIGAWAPVSRDFWSMVKQNSVGNFMWSELEPFLSNKKNMEMSVSDLVGMGSVHKALCIVWKLNYWEWKTFQHVYIENSYESWIIQFIGHGSCFSFFSFLVFLCLSQHLD